MAEKNLEIPLLLDIYGELLTQKQRDMLELYYCDDLSLSEIAQQEDVSRQGVRDSIKRGEDALLDFEKKLCCLKSEKARKDEKALIKSLCEDIITDCRTYTTTKSVIQKLEKIIALIESSEDNG